MSESWNPRTNLQTLVTELNRRRESAIDFVADVRTLQVDAGTAGLMLKPKAGTQAAEFLDAAGAPIMPNGLRQLGERQIVPVPGMFLDRLAAERPRCAVELLNGLMAQPNGQPRRLVRCLDGQVRAVLSDRYRVLDHFDLAFESLQAVQAAGGEVLDCTLTDRIMVLKFTSRAAWDRLAAAQKDGNAGSLGNHTWIRATRTDHGPMDDNGNLPAGPETVWPLCTVRNSETGHGGLSVSFGIISAICFNSVITQSAFRQVHLGGENEVGRYSEETQAADSKALYLKARDMIAQSMRPETLREIVAKLRPGTEAKIEAPTTAVANIAKAHGLTDEARDGILEHFLRDYKPTVYGLSQAVSRYAQDVADGDAAHDLETVAGEIATSGRKLVAV